MNEEDVGGVGGSRKSSRKSPRTHRTVDQSCEEGCVSNSVELAPLTLDEHRFSHVNHTHVKATKSFTYCDIASFIGGTVTKTWNNVGFEIISEVVFTCDT